MPPGIRTPTSLARAPDPTDPDDPPLPPPTASSSRGPSRATTPTPQPATRESSTTSTSTSSTRAATKLHPKRALSATPSPIPSREPSPARPPVKSSAARPTGPSRSRKNSFQDTSPSRSSTPGANPPSAAATQRALSTASTPTLYPNLSESTIKAPVPQKPFHLPEPKDVPRWPTSPRLKSPPPTNKPTITSPRKTDQQDTLPAINALRALQPTDQLEPKQRMSDSEAEDLLLPPPGMRTPARGASGTTPSTLETVQEVSQASSPAQGLEERVLQQLEDGIGKAFSGQDAPNTSSGKPSKMGTAPAANESGSESGGGRGEIKMKTTSTATANALRPSAPAVKAFGTGRGKPSGEGSTRNMTVETETVSSIPQVAVGGPAGNGSIRPKPSSETIRPKKEKKKPSRKTPSVTSGTGEHSNSSRFRFHYLPGGDGSGPTAASRSPERANGQGPYPPHDGGAVSPVSPGFPAVSRRPSLHIQRVGSMLTRTRPASSKADIFEAKVASAVDEANSSDSEETFVYESNPPDTTDRPRRYHSRTPSTTSMASQIDQRNGPRSAVDAGHSVAMKKSMKFANSFTSNGPDSTTGEDDGTGTARSNIGTGRGTTHHHHHIGRWGRNGGNGHASLFDNESPFPNAAKPKFSGGGPRHTPGATSPRLQNSRTAGNGKKSSPISSSYDLDDGADDERTPLISTIRSGRSTRGRRGAASSIRQLEHQAVRHDRSFLARFAGCLLLSIMIILALSGAGAFMFATTQPLVGVKIIALKNVLASEQDVIFDIKVQARNPNIIAVGIDTADLVIFAKSRWAGTDSEWWSRPPRDMRRRRAKINGDSSGSSTQTTGNNDDADPNLEIGHVYELYSPLSFEGSPFQQARPASSEGQIRIDHPGNKTIPAGSERWGRVLQHEFDLIVRGTLKYSLPLSSRVRSVPVEGRVTVKPNAADLDPDTVHINSDELLIDTQRG